MAARLELTLLWYRPHCFYCANQVVLMLTYWHLHEKSREVCIKARSSLAAARLHSWPANQAHNCKMAYFFFPDTASVHTHLANLNISHALSRVKNNKSATNRITCGRGNFWIAQSGKKKLGIHNSDPDSCGQGVKENDKSFKFQQSGSVFITKPLKGNEKQRYFQFQNYLKLQWNLHIT